MRRFARTHRPALYTIAAAVASELVLGTVFAAADHVIWGDGLFLSMAIGSTSGYAQVPVTGWLPHLLVIGMFWIIVPLIAATFSLFTSRLTAGHVAADAGTRHEDMKAHVSAVMTAQVAGVHRKLDQHADLIRAAGQVKGGSQ